MALRKNKTLLDQASEYVESARPQVEAAVATALEAVEDFVENTARPALADARDKAVPVMAAGAAKATQKAVEAATAGEGGRRRQGRRGQGRGGEEEEGQQAEEACDLCRGGRGSRPRCQQAAQRQGERQLAVVVRPDAGAGHADPEHHLELEPDDLGILDDREEDHTGGEEDRSQEDVGPRWRGSRRGHRGRGCESRTRRPRRRSRPRSSTSTPRRTPSSRARGSGGAVGVDPDVDPFPPVE